MCIYIYTYTYIYIYGPKQSPYWPMGHGPNKAHIGPCGTWAPMEPLLVGLMGPI